MNWGDFMIGVVVGYGILFVMLLVFAWYGFVIKYYLISYKITNREVRICLHIPWPFFPKNSY